MRFFMGLGVGAALVWLTQTDEGRRWLAQLREGKAPWLLQAQQTAAANVSTGAQRVSETIDSAPLPTAVKSAANDAAFSAWSAAQSVIEEPPSGTSAETSETEPGA
jgi:hypothetical protein